MRFAGRFVAKGVLMLIAIAVLGYLVMLLWNAVVPGVLVGVHPIDYWRALGLLVLSRILFGGFRGHGRHAHWHRFNRNSRDDRRNLRDFLKFAAQHHDGPHDIDL